MFMLDKYISEQLPDAFEINNKNSETDLSGNDKEETLEELLVGRLNVTGN